MAMQNPFMDALRSGATAQSVTARTGMGFMQNAQRAISDSASLSLKMDQLLQEEQARKENQLLQQQQMMQNALQSALSGAIQMRGQDMTQEYRNKALQLDEQKLAFDGAKFNEQILESEKDRAIQNRLLGLKEVEALPKTVKITDPLTGEEKEAPNLLYYKAYNAYAKKYGLSPLDTTDSTKQLSAPAKNETISQPTDSESVGSNAIDYDQIKVINSKYNDTIREVIDKKESGWQEEVQKLNDERANEIRQITGGRTYIEQSSSSEQSSVPSAHGATLASPAVNKSDYTPRQYVMDYGKYPALNLEESRKYDIKYQTLKPNFIMQKVYHETGRKDPGAQIAAANIVQKAYKNANREGKKYAFSQIIDNAPSALADPNIQKFGISSGVTPEKYRQILIDSKLPNDKVKVSSRIYEDMYNAIKNPAKIKEDVSKKIRDNKLFGSRHEIKKYMQNRTYLQNFLGKFGVDAVFGTRWGARDINDDEIVDILTNKAVDEIKQTGLSPTLAIIKDNAISTADAGVLAGNTRLDEQPGAILGKYAPGLLKEMFPVRGSTQRAELALNKGSAYSKITSNVLDEIQAKYLIKQKNADHTPIVIQFRNKTFKVPYEAGKKINAFRVITKDFSQDEE